MLADHEVESLKGVEKAGKQLNFLIGVLCGIFAALTLAHMIERFFRYYELRKDRF